MCRPIATATLWAEVRTDGETRSRGHRERGLVHRGRTWLRFRVFFGIAAQGLVWVQRIQLKPWIQRPLRPNLRTDDKPWLSAPPPQTRGSGQCWTSPAPIPSRTAWGSHLLSGEQHVILQTPSERLPLWLHLLPRGISHEGGVTFLVPFSEDNPTLRFLSLNS